MLSGRLVEISSVIVSNYKSGNSRFVYLGCFGPLTNRKILQVFSLFVDAQFCWFEASFWINE